MTLWRYSTLGHCCCCPVSTLRPAGLSKFLGGMLGACCCVELSPRCLPILCYCCGLGCTALSLLHSLQA